ncbi:MAG: hypothetical protein ABUT20_55165 [Bacteroidota bacterium]
MDSKKLKEKLNKVFCEIGKKGKSYSKVWLEDADFGGMYHSGKYILNVKANHRIKNCSSEIDDVLHLLDDQAKDELPYIWRVYVYHDDIKDAYCSSEQIVYEEENACP